MRVTLIFFIFTFFSCTTLEKKNYVCGDRPCIDKKEFNDYFARNLTIELKLDKKNKNKKVDLIRLNTEPSSLKKKNYKVSKKEKNLKKKAELEKLKIEKAILKEQRKIKKERENRKLKEEKQMAKISQSKTKKKKNKEIEINNREIVKKNVVDMKKNVKKDTTQIIINENKDVKSLCDNIHDCDIDKITEILIKKGQDKSYPNITSN